MRRAEPNGGVDHSGSEIRRDRRGPTGARGGPGARRLRVGLEALEGRLLLAGVIAEYPLPSPSQEPFGITAGPDGALWFAETEGGKIGRITTGGALTEFPIAHASSPAGITAGPDGALWFTESAGNGIGRITTNGALTEFPIPTPASRPLGITAGPDGALWFTESAGNGIGRITTGGAVTEFPIPTPASFPYGITAGPDGALWFTESAGNGIGRITTNGALTEFPIPTPASRPLGITAGPDGALWFTESAGNGIGRITTGGAVTEFPIPTPASFPYGITAGPDGNLWFTEFGTSNNIGRITTGGAVTEFPIPTPASSPAAITTGPDGDLWFTELVANKIGQLSPRPSTQTQLTAGPNPSLAGQPVTFTAVVTPGQGGVTPTGSVSFSDDGGAATVVPLSLVGGRMQASLTVATLPEGNHTVVASYGGSPGLDPSSATQAVSVLLPPTVVSVQRFGFHADPTRIVLAFSSPLDPTRAQDLRNYRIVGPDGKALAIDSATYDPAATTVTLRPHARLDLHRLYELTVVGTAPDGVADTSGVLLDGAGNGQPGSKYVATLKASDLVLGAEVPGGPRRLAALRRTLAKIEADQSKQLARKQVAPKARAIARAHPAKATGGPSAGKK